MDAKREMIVDSGKVAIETRYFGPTDTKGSRIWAWEPYGQRLMLHVDHSKSVDDNHLEAARRLCAKMGWTGRMVGGETKGGMAWVFAE